MKDFGEVQAIGEKAKWHFIGTLQSRKVKDIIDKVDMLFTPWIVNP